MFWFTRKPSLGSHSQYLAKITHLVQSGYIDLVQDVSVMAAYCDLWGVCTVHCVRVKKKLHADFTEPPCSVLNSTKKITKTKVAYFFKVPLPHNI